MASPVSNEVETIVLRCLAKEPERRYPSAGDLARDVRHYLAAEPIEATRGSLVYLLLQRLHDHRIPVVVAAVFVIVVVAGGVTGRPHDELKDAVGPFEQALPIRTRIEPTTLLAEVVDQVRRSRVLVERWQEYARSELLALEDGGRLHEILETPVRTGPEQRHVYLHVADL